MIKPYQVLPHIPGLPPVYPKPKPKAAPRRPDQKLDHAIIAVGRESIGGRTYLIFGNGTYALIAPRGAHITSSLASRQNRAIKYYEDIITKRSDFMEFLLDEPPHAARWYWINWPEIKLRALSYLVWDLQQGKIPQNPDPFGTAKR